MTKVANHQGSKSHGHTGSNEDLAARIALLAAEGRIVVAIVGAPGSGKSTATEALESALVGTHGLTAQTVPMDGFHYDNAILQMRGLIARKGAPETFDVGGLEAALKRLTEPDQPQDVAVPVFDRNIDLARASARLIDRATRVLLVEGNYLLMTEDPWSRLESYFDLSVMIPSDLPLLRARLLQRWRDLDFGEEHAIEKVETNDLPNARRVINESRPADFNLVWIDRDGVDTPAQRHRNVPEW